MLKMYYLFNLGFMEANKESGNVKGEVLIINNSNDNF